MTRHPGTPPRRGTAILIALVALVVLAILSTGAVMSATQEFRAGRNSLVEQRALAVAEYGLNQQVAGWNDPVTLAKITAMTIGGIDSSSRYAVNGDSARVTVMRLSPTSFLVVSNGRANSGNGQLEAERRTELLMKVAGSGGSTAFRPAGAVVLNGDISVKGNATISGSNATPSGWTDCPQPAPADAFALALNTNATADIQKPGNITGGTTRSAKSSDSLTYTQFGSDTWTSLVARANVRLSGGSPNPAPVGDATTCTPTSSNWGEPRRDGTAVRGCTSYFPVVYTPGDFEISSGRGQGVLLVAGKLVIKGNFTWVGLIVVKGELDQESGTASVTGSILSRNTSRNTTDITGTINITYSSCALDAALKVSGPTVSRVSQRSWVQRF